MAIRVLINGAFGKMGTLASETLQKQPNFDLVGRLSHADPLQQKIDQLQPDVVLDLTRADSVYNNALTIIKAGVHPVIGTTGLSDSEIKQLQTICLEKKLGGIIAPNFSLGAILMMRFAALAASHMASAVIIEAHHPQKFDAPSGTALKTAELIAKARTQKPEPSLSHELVPGVCGGKHHDIPIHSLRLSGFMAEQEVIFGNIGETLSIKHKSIDRSCFMPGIILCCQKVVEFESLYYGMENLI